MEPNVKTVIENLSIDTIVLLIFSLLAIIVVLIILLNVYMKKHNEAKKSLYMKELSSLLCRQDFDATSKEILAKYPDRYYVLVDFDINNFKDYNAIHGFEKGNEILSAIIAYCQKNCREGETCSRLESDHFICLIYGNDLEEIIARVEQSNEAFKNISLNRAILLSFGIFEITDKAASMVSMRDNALIAKRRVKGNYDKFIGVYDKALRDKQIENIELINSMEEGLENGEFVPYYQPKYNAKTRKIVGAEALVRWIRPNDIVIPPCRFISLFESSGLIIKLDMHMFEKVCQKLAKYIEDKNPNIVPISVNFSRAHLYTPNFVEKLAAIADKYSIPHDLLEIELTESIFFDNQIILTDVIEQIHDRGFFVSMDDFGSGFSSLNMLKDIYFDIVKIDKGFLNETYANLRSKIVMKEMINLTQALDITSIAEGVETKEQLDFMIDCGCNYIQGYYFAKPMPEEEFDTLLSTYGAS